MFAAFWFNREFDPGAARGLLVAVFVSAFLLVDVTIGQLNGMADYSCTCRDLLAPH